MKTLIVTGGAINKEVLIKNIENNKFNNIIAIDRGLEILEEIEIMPTHIVGDFDSIKNIDMLNKYKNVLIQKLNPEKDYTDTDTGMELAINLNSKEVIIIGATGTRLDHTIANIQNMKKMLNKEILCKIIDYNNEIMLIDRTTKIEKNSEYTYISLLPLESKAEGITLKGFKYPLNNKTLEIGESIGISNEQMELIGTIEIKRGILLVIKSKD